MATKNPILKSIKEGDIVLVSIPSNLRPIDYKQICKLRNVNYQPIDNDFDFDWLEFETDVLYTNFRHHKTTINNCITNCLGICEIIPPHFVETTAKLHMMWKPSDNLLSDDELAHMIRTL